MRVEKERWGRRGEGEGKEVRVRGKRREGEGKER